MPIIIPPAPIGAPFADYTWVDWYQKVRFAINDVNNINHNDLQNIQGGSSGNYYHLTSTQLGNIQYTTAKDSASGYAGLNASSRVTKGVDTTDDVIIDLATKGLVLKDTQGTPHYWRVTIDNTGVLQTADLGTTKP